VDDVEDEEVAERGGRSSWERGRERTEGSEEEFVEILFRRESRRTLMSRKVALSPPPAK